MHRLDGRLVTDELYAAIRQIRGRGGRVFFAQPDGGGCSNCGGAGRLYVEFLTGGPDTSPRGVSKQSEGGSVTVETTLADGSGRGWDWYRMKSRAAMCPVCKGSGEGAPVAQRLASPDAIRRAFAGARDVLDVGRTTGARRREWAANERRNELVRQSAEADAAEADAAQPKPVQL